MVVPLQRETRSIPIVFVRVSDPIAQGIVESLARPNGYLTGFSNPELPLMGKWLQILKDIAPSVTRVGLMISTFNAASAYHYRSFDAAVPKPRFGLPGCYLLSVCHDSRLANLLKLLVVLICLAAILQRVLPLAGIGWL